MIRNINQGEYMYMYIVDINICPYMWVENVVIQSYQNKTVKSADLNTDTAKMEPGHEHTHTHSTVFGTYSLQDANG